MVVEMAAVLGNFVWDIHPMFVYVLLERPWSHLLPRFSIIQSGMTGSFAVALLVLDSVSP